MLSPVLTLCLEALFSLVSTYDCDRRARSSTKSKSSNWLQRVHWISFLLFLCFSYISVVLLIIQSMADRKMRNDDRRHPCLTPVNTMTESMSCPVNTMTESMSCPVNTMTESMSCPV